MVNAEKHNEHEVSQTSQLFRSAFEQEERGRLSVEGGSSTGKERADLYMANAERFAANLETAMKAWRKERGLTTPVEAGSQ